MLTTLTGDAPFGYTDCRNNVYQSGGACYGTTIQASVHQVAASPHHLGTATYATPCEAGLATESNVLVF